MISRDLAHISSGVPRTFLFFLFSFPPRLVGKVFAQILLPFFSLGLFGGTPAEQVTRG
jgi:hypothetical protein